MQKTKKGLWIWRNHFLPKRTGDRAFNEWMNEWINEWMSQKDLLFYSATKAKKNNFKIHTPLIHSWQHKLVLEFMYFFIYFFLSWVALFASKINSSLILLLFLAIFNRIKDLFLGGDIAWETQKNSLVFFILWFKNSNQTLVTEYFSFVCFCCPHHVKISPPKYIFLNKNKNKNKNWHGAHDNFQPSMSDSLEGLIIFSI